MGLSLPGQHLFHYDGPIRQPGLFFDREAVVNDVLYSLLENAQDVSVIGREKIGKTSLLFHVARADVIAEVATAYDFTPCPHAFAYIDCESMKEMDEGGCYRWIREALVRQVLDRGTYSVSASDGNSPSDAYAELRSVLRMLKGAAIRLVVQFDEFEWFAKNSRLSYRFFGALRALTSSFDVCYLSTSRVSLAELERRAPRIAGSPFFSNFLPMELMPFEPDVSHELLESRLAPVGIALPAVIESRVYELSQHEPYRLQLAGACAYGLWCKDGELGEGHCDELERWINHLISGDCLDSL